MAAPDEAFFQSALWQRRAAASTTERPPTTGGVPTLSPPLASSGGPAPVIRHWTPALTASLPLGGNQASTRAPRSSMSARRPRRGNGDRVQAPTAYRSLSQWRRRFRDRHDQERHHKAFGHGGDGPGLSPVAVAPSSRSTDEHSPPQEQHHVQPRDPDRARSPLARLSRSQSPLPASDRQQSREVLGIAALQRLPDPVADIFSPLFALELEQVGTAAHLPPADHSLRQTLNRGAPIRASASARSALLASAARSRALSSGSRLTAPRRQESRPAPARARSGKSFEVHDPPAPSRFFAPRHSILDDRGGSTSLARGPAQLRLLPAGRRSRPPSHTRQDRVVAIDAEAGGDQAEQRGLAAGKDNLLDARARERRRVVESTIRGLTPAEPAGAGVPEAAVSPTANGQSSVSPTANGQSPVSPTVSGQSPVSPTANGQSSVSPTANGQTHVATGSASGGRNDGSEASVGLACGTDAEAHALVSAWFAELTPTPP